MEKNNFGFVVNFSHIDNLVYIYSKNLSNIALYNNINISDEENVQLSLLNNKKIRYGNSKLLIYYNFQNYTLDEYEKLIDECCTIFCADEREVFLFPTDRIGLNNDPISTIYSINNNNFNNSWQNSSSIIGNSQKQTIFQKVVTIGIAEIEIKCIISKLNDYFNLYFFTNANIPSYVLEDLIEMNIKNKIQLQYKNIVFVANKIILHQIIRYYDDDLLKYFKYAINNIIN